MEEVGREDCRRINVILSKYNLPRYPGMVSLDSDEVRKDIEFIEYLIKVVVPSLF